MKAVSSLGESIMILRRSSIIVRRKQYDR